MTALPDPERPAPLPLPLRVLFKGTSQVNWTSYMGGGRENFTYPRVTEEALLRGGRPVTVVDHSMIGELTKHAVKNWRRQTLGFSPDVVVLQYGQMETLHLVLPAWLQAHAQSWETRPGPVRDRYRAMVRPTWRRLCVVQQKLDQRFDSRTGWQGHADRIEADLKLLVKRLRTMHSPLVLIFDQSVPATTYQRWFPGCVDRMELVRAGLERVIAAADSPDVRLFPLPEVLSRLADPIADVDELTPDGAHYTPAAHRVIGEALATEIEAWARTQPHLRQRAEAQPEPRPAPANGAVTR